jgi:hypothetical protein
MSINVADNFSYKGGKPLDARTKYASISDMVATPAADLYDGCLAYVTAEKKNYQYDSTNTTDPTLGKWRELETGGGGGTTYTAGDGIDITSDVISTDNLQSGDMDDVVTPLPSIPARYHKYSTDEQIVGEWIDGSPIYEKTLDITETSISSGSFAVNHNISNVGNYRVIVDAVVMTSTTGFTLPYIASDGKAYSAVSSFGNSAIYFAGTSGWGSSEYSHIYVTLRYTKTTD